MWGVKHEFRRPSLQKTIALYPSAAADAFFCSRSRRLLDVCVLYMHFFSMNLKCFFYLLFFIHLFLDCKHMMQLQRWRHCSKTYGVCPGHYFESLSFYSYLMFELNVRQIKFAPCNIQSHMVYPGCKDATQCTSSFKSHCFI